MNVLVVDIGGTHVKVLATGQTRAAEVSVRADADARSRWSPRSRSSSRDWKYDVVSIGYPGASRSHDHPVAEPRNLGRDGSASTSRPPSGVRSR